MVSCCSLAGTYRKYLAGKAKASYFWSKGKLKIKKEATHLLIKNIKTINYQQKITTQKIEWKNVTTKARK